MKILITGANGFIGKNLQAELKNRGFNELFLCTRETEPEELARYAQECDIVYHLAGVNRPNMEADYWEGNAVFTEKLLNLLEKNEKNPQVIFASSVQAAQGNAYGKSKREAERLIEGYGKKNNAAAVLYRLPNVFGKWCRPDYNSVVATFCYNINHGKEIKIDNKSAVVKLVYIDDVVQSLVEELEGNPKKNNVVYREIEDCYKITVGELADKLMRFHAFRTNLEIPELGNALDKKLYSTFLSYLKKTDFKYPLKMNTDDRGSFTEFIRTENKGQFSVNISRPGIVKGNHWHHTKVEKFLVVRGEALIQFRNILTDEKIEYRVSGDKLEVVDIPVGYTHCIKNTGIDELVTIMWANESFDSKRPDTYYEEV